MTAAVVECPGVGDQRTVGTRLFVVGLMRSRTAIACLVAMVQAVQVVSGTGSCSTGNSRPRSQSPEGIPVDYDLIDEFGDSFVRFYFGVRADSVPVGYSCIVQQTANLVLRQKTLVIHGEQERLADRKGSHSSLMGLDGHRGCSLLDVSGQGKHSVRQNLHSGGHCRVPS